MGIPSLNATAEVISRKHGKNSKTTNYLIWAVYTLTGAAAGHYAGRIHKFAPLAIATTLSLAEVIDSKEFDMDIPDEHILEFKMSRLGFAIPFARAFALSAGITAAGPHVMNAIANRAINGASALQIAEKARPALFGLATFGRTFYSFTLHDRKNQSFGLRLSYALDLYREVPNKKVEKEKMEEE